jgi:hypothetical protein
MIESTLEKIASGDVLPSLASSVKLTTDERSLIG